MAARAKNLNEDLREKIKRDKEKLRQITLKKRRKRRLIF